MQHTTQQKMSQGRQERHGDAIGSFIIDKSALSDDVGKYLTHLGKYWIILGKYWIILSSALCSTQHSKRCHKGGRRGTEMQLEALLSTNLPFLAMWANTGLCGQILDYFGLCTSSTGEELMVASGNWSIIF